MREREWEREHKGNRGMGTERRQQRSWENEGRDSERKTKWGKGKKEYILHCVHLSGVKWLKTWQDIWGEVGGYKYFSANNKWQTLNCMPVGFLLIQTHPNKDCTSTLHCLHFSQKHLANMNQVSRSETSVALMALGQKHSHAQVWKCLSNA